MSPALGSSRVVKTFTSGGRTVEALGGVSLEMAEGTVNGLLGPDGAGKTTFIRLAAGLLVPDSGFIEVLGLDSAKDSREIQSRIGYMPQRFGLYEDLTVMENLELYGDLQSVPRDRREERYPELMRMTGLSSFTSRLAGNLSGGMKQKLGLACTLIKLPELLLLDEPTVGVDPVSRRELWQIVYSLVKERSLTVLMSTAYLDEAERCSEVFVLDKGELLGSGEPAAFTRRARSRTWLVKNPDDPRRLQADLVADSRVTDAAIRAGRVRLVLEEGVRPEDVGLDRAEEREPDFEDGFMVLLHGRASSGQSGEPESSVRPSGKQGGKIISVQNLTRRFGDFYAVKDLSFSVRRGEIFGLLGPNGAGKSTTFRMLCGLLPPSSGELEVAGVDLRSAPAKARANVGYMAQKFSLYGQLTVRENLSFFASAYGLSGGRKRERIRWALDSLDLEPVAETESLRLPFGIKQRLSLACALMHEPEILFLDEPTSGVDPLARRTFWKRISRLSELGVTVIVTTHFMEEAEYCHRMAIMLQGELLALGAPEEIREQSGGKSMEQAFINLVEDSGEEAA